MGYTHGRLTFIGCQSFQPSALFISTFFVWWYHTPCYLQMRGFSSFPTFWLMDFVHLRVGSWPGFWTSTYGIHSFRFALSLRRCLSNSIFNFLLRDVHFCFWVSRWIFLPDEGEEGDFMHGSIYAPRRYGFSRWKFRSRHPIFRQRIHAWHALMSYMLPPVPMTSIVRILTSRSVCGFLLHIVWNSFKCGHPRVVSFSEASFSALRSSFRFLRFFIHYSLV